MKQLKLIRSFGLLAALATAACQAAPLAVSGPAPLAITGRAVFPGYAVKAVSQDVTGQATVSLLDASGATLAAGVTDADGRFSLYTATKPFAPEPGDAFTLVVTKRVQATIGAPLLSLRTTIVRTEEGGWNSFSGPSILVNVATSTLAKLQERDPALTTDLLLGKVTGTDIAPVPNHSDAEVDALEDAVAANLTNDLDPSGAFVHHGDLYVQTEDDLAGLENVEIWDGSIYVFGEEAVSGLNMPHLRRITGELSFSGGNSGIHDMRGLKSLEQVGRLSFEYAPVLESLKGLERLKTIDGSLTITGCPMLRALADDAVPAAPVGLVNLVSIGESLEVTDNDDLEALGFPKLTSVGKNLDLSSNTLLGSLDGLEGLSTVPGDFTLSDIPASDLSPLSGLGTVGGTLSIGSMNNLVTLNGLGGLTTVGGLTINGNSALESLSGLSQLASVRDGILVMMNVTLDVDCANPFGHPVTSGRAPRFVLNANNCP